jgi:hypothetical protein
METSVSEPLMTYRNVAKTMSKPGACHKPGISLAVTLYPGQTASGIEAAQTCIGLLYGTREPVAAMPRENVE